VKVHFAGLLELFDFYALCTYCCLLAHFLAVAAINTGLE